MSGAARYAYERLHWNQLPRLLSVLDTLSKGRRCFPEYRTLQEGAEFWAGAGASCVRGRCDHLGRVRLPPVFEEGATVSCTQVRVGSKRRVVEVAAL